MFLRRLTPVDPGQMDRKPAKPSEEFVDNTRRTRALEKMSEKAERSRLRGQKKAGAAPLPVIGVSRLGDDPDGAALQSVDTEDPTAVL